MARAKIFKCDSSEHSLGPLLLYNVKNVCITETALSRKQKVPRKIAAEVAAEIQRQPALQDNFRYLAVVLFAALFIRLFYLHQIKSDILSNHLVVDAKFYDDWARRIVGGEWLGTAVFYQDPFYAYFLACLYKIWGHSLSAVRVCQALLDTGTVALVYFLSRRLFNPSVGLIAAAMTAMLSPLVYYVGLLDKTTVSVFLATAALTITANAIAGSGLLLYAAGGAAFGLAALSRGNLLVVAAAAFLWILIGKGIGEIAPGLKRSASFGLGVLAIVGVVALRNYFVGRDIVLITANPGLNFFIGNNPYTIGQYIEPPFLRGVPEDEYEDAKVAAEKFSGRKLTKSSEVSRYWFGRGLEFVSQQTSAWLTLSARKIFLALNNFEIAETYSYSYFQEKYSALTFAAVTYGVVASFGLVGAILLLLKGQFNILHVFASFYLISLVAFFVTSRYRIPLAVAWIPFGAWLLVELRNERSNAAFQLRVVPALAAALFLSYWQPAWVRERVIMQSLATAHTVAGYTYLSLGDEANSIRELKAAITAYPGSSINYVYLGEIYWNRGDMNAAFLNYEQALRLNPQQDLAWGRIGQIYFDRKDYQRAAVAFQNALKIHPNEPIYQKNYDAAVNNFRRTR